MKENTTSVDQEIGSRNHIEEIITLVVSLVRYSGPFLEWTREELREMNQRTKKSMTMLMVLHSKDYKERLYVVRSEYSFNIIIHYKTKLQNLNK